MSGLIWYPWVLSPKAELPDIKDLRTRAGKLRGFFLFGI
jgi:hypothetical protein